MQIETPVIPEKNSYHEIFKVNCQIVDEPTNYNQENIEKMMIQIGLIHNALGLAFIHLVKCINFLLLKYKIISIWEFLLY